ncbi:MAG TPA: hypothetical protein PLF27_03450 [Sedimentibacter sp.]|jgi:hypothetical protein|nr:hypothetical protein [Sedimentibacter sp.]HRC80422.1 hypothetical protein [Sedimentibacter sp.]
MLIGKQNTKIRRVKNMHPIVFLPLFIAVLMVISACTATKGSIVILENPNGSGFTMDFKDWSSQNKCELSLVKGDEIQVEVACKYGEIVLLINGKKGSEPYMGNGLKSCRFTVTVSETDEYVIQVTGKNASGKITVKKI